MLIHWLVPTMICPAFSWCGVRLYMSDIDYVNFLKERNSLWLSNHGSRIDWVMARFLGFASPTVRVNFVMESFLKWMPAVGWHCNWIAGDIFVKRSFKQDRVEIQRWIRNMRQTNIPCLLFLAPEGMIVDTTSKRNALGRKYLLNCRNFCEQQGYPKFEYVLTPRYKGISVLKEHANAVGGDIVSATMAFTRDGKLLNNRLDSPSREIPDLYAVYAGLFGKPLIVYAHLHKIELCDEPAELKRIMMEDYLRKDKLLKHFDERGYFPDENGENTPYDLVEVPHVRLNVLFFSHTFSVFFVGHLLGQWQLLKYCIVLMLFSFTFFNTFGRFIFGYSIESLPFETGLKPLLFLYYELFTSNFKLEKIARAAGNLKGPAKDRM